MESTEASAAATRKSATAGLVPRGAVRGMLLVALSAFGFSCMHALIRSLSAEVHSFQIAFARNLFGLLILVPWFLRHGTAGLRTERFGGHVGRAVLQTVAMLCFFTALSRTPLALASALSFTAPLFATVGAVVFLRERIHARRISALLVGFAGALVIVRPGVAPLDLGPLLVLLSSAFWALAMLVIKSLSRTDSSATLTAWMCLLMTPMTLLPALAVWTWPSPTQWALLVCIGIAGSSAQFSMAEGFRHADATTVMPADFTRLLWASLLGLTIFGEVPVIWTYVGGSMILGATAVLAWRESRSAARRMT